MVWSPGAVAVEFRDVLQRHCFSMLLSILFNTFWQGTQKSNTNLNNIFYTSFRFDKLLSEIDNVFQKRRL